MSDHRCDLPFTGSLHQCPTCGAWFQVVVFRDEEHGLAWKGWEQLEGSR
jgi:hypothetical protein